jgi:uncharacterized protein YbjT (DUF2867 family)
LRAGPDDWTIVRPGFFAQNIGTAYRQDIVEDNRIYLPAGHGRAAFVDLRDVGEVAARVLIDPAPHQCETYTLTGPEAFDFDQVAAFLSEALDRVIRYDRASWIGYLFHLRRRGIGLGQAMVLMILHVGLRFGQAESVDPTLERLLGRRPFDVHDFIRDHTSLWEASS